MSTAEQKANNGGYVSAGSREEVAESRQGVGQPAPMKHRQPALAERGALPRTQPALVRASGEVGGYLARLLCATAGPRLSDRGGALRAGAGRGTVRPRHWGRGAAEAEAQRCRCLC